MPKNTCMTPTERELTQVIDALLEYIDAIPDDVVAELPAMPGISRDYVDELLYEVKNK